MTRIILRGLAALRRDQRGVSAVEFALIAPILILIYFGLAELAQAMTVQRRVSHAAAAVGDLVSQNENVAITDTEMTDILAAASKIVDPYPTAPLKLRITSVTGNASGEPRVDWSDGATGLAAYAHCATVPGFPATLITMAGENVIMAEAAYAYTSPIAKVIPNGLNFSDKFYLKPRKVNKVARQGETTTAC